MRYRDNDTKTFKENTKGMTFGQKLGYIWDYYKVWILTAAFVCFASISIGTAVHRNHLAMQLVQLGVLNEACPTAEAFWQEEATIISVPYLGVDTPVTLMLGARIAANELDVCLLPDNHTTWIRNQDATVPLEEVLTLPEGVETLRDEETGEIFAICINDTPFFREADGASEYVADLYLSISAQAERLPAAIDFAQRIVDSIGT